MAIWEEIEEEVEGNIEERLKASRAFVDEQIETFREAIDKTLQLMPAQAALGFIGDTIRNLTRLLTRQAEITSRWLRR